MDTRSTSIITKNLFIISGPSAAGEDSIIEGLREHFPVRQSITTTSRPMRDGEHEGKPYYFVSDETFKSKIEKEELVEWDFHNDHYYGITRGELSRISREDSIGLWKVDYKGVINAKNIYPEIIAIHVSAGSIEVLRDRLIKRDGNKPAYIEERLEYAKKWDEHADIFDYTVYNRQNMLQQAIADVSDIIRKHACITS